MIKTITYDDTLYQLVPKEATQDILSRVEDLHEKAGIVTGKQIGRAHV